MEFETSACKSHTKTHKGKVEEWSRMIPRKETATFKLSENSHVCERHFEEDDLERFWKHSMPDGSVSLVYKTIPTLKPDAKPRIFPNLPERLSKPTKKRKPPPKRHALAPKKKKNDESLPDSPPPTQSSDEERGEDPEDNNSQALTEVTPAENPASTPSPDAFNIHTSASSVKLPGSKWGVCQDSQNETTVFLIINDLLDNEKCVRFRGSDPPEIFIRRKKIKEDQTCQSSADVERLLQEVHGWRLCPGSEMGGCSKNCTQYISVQSKQLRCLHCRMLKQALAKREKRASAKAKTEAKTVKMTELRRVRQQKRRLQKKVEELQEQLGKLQEEYKNVEESAVERLIKDLPPLQQAAIKTCVAAGKARGPKGVRYTRDWIYACIRLRMKSTALYEKMRTDKLLPLPSQTTLRKYLRKLKPEYGFKEATFSMMKKKGEHMPEAHKHGAILADEMKLSKGVFFNKNTLEVEGVVDLGRYTPEEKEGQMGDHALTLMFQPFQGDYIQVIGTFLSAGPTPGQILDKLFLEATVLLENAGFFVDDYVTDGATWNRWVWKHNGVNGENPSMPHPVREGARIWFSSDFPHLMKTAKSRIIHQGTLETPDGIVQLKHWQKIVEKDEASSGIKRCPKLTRSHLEPSQFQVMNVKMAFTFFSGTVADVMRTYKEEGHPDFEDAQPTIKFVERMNRMAQVMNSRRPWDCLYADKDSPSNKELQDFLEYLDAWDECCPNQSGKFTKETHLGLKVTILGALELVDYLSKEVGYTYLMTRRINQDALEHFFGHVRQACGDNQHPDPLQYIQVYGLLSCNSLIKPPRGSNVSGAEMVSSLLTLDDTLLENGPTIKEKFEERLDAILTEGDVEAFSKVVDHTYATSAIPNVDSIDVVALSYFAGYVARRAKVVSFAKSCQSCMESLLASPAAEKEPEDRLIELRSKGFLFTPSLPLKNLLYQLESAIVNAFDKQQQGTMPRPVILEVLEEVSTMDITTRVGCDDHRHDLTKWITRFFLRTRLIFACKDFVKTMERAKKVKRTQARQLKKTAKLI